MKTKHPNKKKTDLIQDFINAGGLSTASQFQYERILTKLLADCDPEKITAEGLRNWLANQRTWGESYKWVAFCVAKSFLRWRYGKDHPALVLRMKRQDCTPQRSLSLGQVQTLLDSFDQTTPKGIRDLAICELLLDTGLRSAEVCSLQKSYIDLANRSLEVRVKGGAWASAVYSEYTADHLESWLVERQKFAPGSEHAFFVGIGGVTPGRKLTTHGLRAIMRVWAQNAGLKALSPHDLRRTFATLAIQAGAPSRVVQAAGRWKHIEMVERYTQAITPEDMDGWYPVPHAMSCRLELSVA